MKHQVHPSQFLKLKAMKRYVMLLCISMFTLSATAATFTVTTTADAGAGSLRQAITDANLNAGDDIIEFNIGGGGAQSISIVSDLPISTGALTIDGATQSGYTGTPLISIGASWTGTILSSNAAGAVVLNALDISRTGSVAGIGIVVVNATSLSITNCYMKDRTYGVQISSCTDVTFTGNDLTNSGSASGYAMYLIGNTGTFTATGNTFGGTTVSGIRIISMSDITIAPSSGNIQIGTQLKEIITPIVISGGSNITITDLDLGKSTAGGNALDVSSVTNLSITNCIVGNRTYGLLLSSNTNTTITGNNLTNSGISGGFAMYLSSNSGTFSATGNTFGGSTTSALRMSGMSNITIAPSSGNIQIGTQLKEIITPITIAGGSNITITDLDLGKSTTGGNALDVSGVTNLSITNCIVGNRIYGLILSGNTNTTITGNNLTNSGTSGGFALYLAGNLGTFSVTGNTIGGSTTSGIRMSGMSNITIAPASGNIQVGSQLKEIITPLIIAGCSNITVADLDLGKTASGGNALDLSSTTGLSVTNCIIGNRIYGLLLSSCSNTTITGNNLTNSGTGGGYAMYLNAMTGTLVATGNTFGGLTSGGINLINVSGKTVGATSGDIQVGNQLKEMHTPLAISGGSNMTVTDLDFGKTGSVGNLVDMSNVATVTVTNCIFSNRFYGLIFQGCSNVLATGNTLSNIANHLIYLNAITGTLDVSNNTFGSSGGSGLYMNNMTNRIISDGSVSGTHVVIPDGSVFKTLTGNSIEINGGSNITIENLDLENTGGSRVGTGIQVSNSPNVSIINNQLVKRITGISITDGGNSSVATITCNNSKNNTTGVLFSGVGTGTRVLNNNAIWYNTIGINNVTSPSQTIDATNNWWGGSAGPGVCNNGVQGSSITTSPFASTIPGCVQGNLALIGNEINVKGNTVTIADGDATPDAADHTDVGRVLTGGTIVRTFTIENLGSTDLNISSISSNNGLFSVSGLSLPSPITTGNSATFTVTFSPTASGLQNATITINNDDCDEAVYDFAVQGTGTEPNALHFDGANDYVPVTNLTNPLMGTTPTTIEFWAKAPLQGIGFPICIGTSEVAVRFHSQTHVQLEHYGGPTYDMGAVNDGCWHHYAFTWNGTTVYGFVDGLPAPNPSAVAAFPATSGATLYLGVYNLQYFFTGALDEVRIWNVQRSQAQLQASMYSQLAGNEGGLLAYYNFNQGSAGNANPTVTTLFDNQTNTSAHNGTLANFELNGATSNWITSGAMMYYPEINMKGNNTDIVDGDVIPTSSDHTDFENVLIGTNDVRTFAIQNTGTAALTISSITSSNVKFAVGSLSPAGPIAVNSYATFTVTYNPTDATVQTATITVNNNDCNEAAYDFAVKAIAAPTLGIYPNASVIAGGNTTISPNVAPNFYTSVAVSSGTDFTGILTIDPITGIVRATDAKPAGTYTVTVTAYNAITATATFTLTVTDPTSCQALFTNGTEISGGKRGVSIGDFNGDGKQDLLMSGTADNMLLGLGDGTGNFGSPSSFATGASPFGSAIGDFNNDGKQDYVVANFASTTVSVRLGNGSGSFGSNSNITVGGAPTAVVIGDFNNDGKQDFACANSTSANVSIRLGNGAGSFTNAANVSVQTNPRHIALGDFNEDGKQDLAVPNTDANTVSIRLGDGSGGFTGSTNLSVSTEPIFVAIGDFNEDGHQDIASANQGANNVSIRLGNGAGVFSGTTNITVGSLPISIAAGDFNGDGHLDFVTANGNSDNASVCLGDGSGDFSLATTLAVGNGPRWVAVGDFNADNKQDFVTANTIGNTISIRLGGNNEINVKGNSNDIADGDNIPSNSDHTDFELVAINSTLARTFTIQNTGTATLSINSITVDNANFVVSGAPATVAGTGSATFQVTFSPTAVGVQNATITISNNDCDEPTYDFAITGTGFCEAATITCPADQTANTTSSTCNAVVTYASTPTGNPAPALSYSFSGATTGNGAGDGSGSLFNKGTTTVTVTATNACGTQSCSFDVVVTDATAPSITCAGTVTINNTPGLCTGVTPLMKPTITDNCTLSSVSNALNFDGVNDVVATADFTGTNLVGDLTLEVWFKATSLHGRTLVTRNHTTDFDITLWSNQLNFYHGNGSSYINLTFNYFFNPNTWYHVAVVRNMVAKTVSLYVNGVFQQTIGWGFPDPSTTNAPLFIGKRACCPSFEGSIDEVRIWNVQRTASEIVNNMNNELTGSETGLQHYFKLNDGLAEGNNLNDTISNASSGPNAILRNFALNCTATSNYVSGHVNTNAAAITNNAPCVYPKGNTIVTWTATDASGNPATCTQVVTVIDNETPTLANPGDKAFHTLSNSCDTTYTIVDPITDNCTGATWGYSLSGATSATVTGIADGSNATNVSFNKGVTIVTLTGVDASLNNAVTTSFTVTVTDNKPPSIMCSGPVTINNTPGLCTGSTTLTAPTVIDNCSASGNALNFAGGYVDVPHATSLNLNTAFTLETWVNLSTLGIQHGLIEKYTCGSNYGYILRVSTRITVGVSLSIIVTNSRSRCRITVSHRWSSMQRLYLG